MKSAFPEEAQYLYNYRQIGKLWKLPRTALLVRNPAKLKPHCDVTDHQPRDVNTTEPIYDEPVQVAVKSRQCNGSLARNGGRFVLRITVILTGSSCLFTQLYSLLSVLNERLCTTERCHPSRRMPHPPLPLTH